MGRCKASREESMAGNKIRPVLRCRCTCTERGGEKPGGNLGCTRDEEDGLCNGVTTVVVAGPDVGQPGMCSDEAATVGAWPEVGHGAEKTEPA